MYTVVKFTPPFGGAFSLGFTSDNYPSCLFSCLSVPTYKTAKERESEKREGNKESKRERERGRETMQKNRDRDSLADASEFAKSLFRAIESKDTPASAAVIQHRIDIDVRVKLRRQIYCSAHSTLNPTSL